MKFFGVAIGVVDIISTLKFLTLVLTKDLNTSTPSYQLCTPLTPDPGYRCSCEDFDKNQVVEPHNGFCEGFTVVVVHSDKNAEQCWSNVSSPPTPRSDRKFFGNEFWMLGRKNVAGNESFFALGRKKFENIDKPISAITYDSVQGCLVLAMTGGEGIYTYRMVQKEPVLFLREKGEISSLEFDDWGNNIYWMTSCDGTIKVVSCSTKATMVVRRQKVSSFTFTPFDFVIAPDLGLMFIILVNTMDYSIYSEILQMSGGRPTNAGLLLPSFRYSYYSINHLSLHYTRGSSNFLVTDREKNLTCYVSTYATNVTTTDGNEFLIATEPMSYYCRYWESPSFFSETGLQSRAYALVYESHQLNLKIAAVVPAVDPSNSECRPDNGGCQHLCFMSMYSRITRRRHKVCRRCAPSDDCIEEDNGSVNSTMESSSTKNSPHDKLKIKSSDISTSLESSEERAASSNIEFTNTSTDGVKRTTSSTEVTNKGDDHLLKKNETTKVDQPPAIVNETPVEKTTHIEDHTNVPERKEPMYDNFTNVRLFFFITMILFIIIIVLLITLVIILCYLVVSSRKNRRRKMRVRESIRMDFLKPFEINYID